jgi:hypothetical protein
MAMASPCDNLIGAVQHIKKLLNLGSPPDQDWRAAPALRAHALAVHLLAVQNETVVR